MGPVPQEEQWRLQLGELPVAGRRSNDFSLRKLCQAMDFNLQHRSGKWKGKDELVEGLNGKDEKMS